MSLCIFEYIVVIIICSLINGSHTYCKSFNSLNQGILISLTKNSLNRFCSIAHGNLCFYCLYLSQNPGTNFYQKHLTGYRRR